MGSCRGNTGHKGLSNVRRIASANGHPMCAIWRHKRTLIIIIITISIIVIIIIIIIIVTVVVAYAGYCNGVETLTFQTCK